MFQEQCGRLWLNIMLLRLPIKEGHGFAENYGYYCGQRENKNKIEPLCSLQWLFQFLSGLATCVGHAWLSGDQPRRLLFTWPSRGASAPAGSAGHARALVVLPHLLPPSSGFNFLGSALGSPSSLPSSPLVSWPLGGSAAAVAWQ